MTTRIFINSRQLKRANVLSEHTQNASERYVVEMVQAESPGPPAGAGGPVGGRAGHAGVPGRAAAGAPPGDGAADVDVRAVAVADGADLDADVESSSSAEQTAKSTKERNRSWSIGHSSADAEAISFAVQRILSERGEREEGTRGGLWDNEKTVIGESEWVLGL